MEAALARATGDRFGMATGSFRAERDDWPAAVARARAEGWTIIELTAIDQARLDALVDLLAPEPSTLHGFERVSVHAPVRFDGSGDHVRARLLELPHDVVLHPDVYRDEAWVVDLGPRAVFENMDVAKGFGRELADLREVLIDFPEAGFCLDVAHVWTNDPTLRLGHELIDVLGARLRQLHVSGIEADGTHRPTTCGDLDRYAPLLDRCRDVPWLLEAELVGEPE
jgi:hypothetical protein